MKNEKQMKNMAWASLVDGKSISAIISEIQSGYLVTRKVAKDILYSVLDDDVYVGLPSTDILRLLQLHRLEKALNDALFFGRTKEYIKCLTEYNKLLNDIDNSKKNIIITDDNIENKFDFDTKEL